ncbi:MAG: cation:proton antiporter [archaeon GB-1867-035]|nr:cation:proton antiporter [Candidatus Culexmicrobium profundum]
MIEAINILILISLTILLGFIGSLFYDKTKIPDIIWLLLFGILLGPIFHLYDPELFTRLSNLVSIVALCIILFDAGINVDVGLVIEMLPKSFLLLALTYPLTMVTIGFSLHFLFPNNFSLLEGLLLGGMVSGTSTVTTIGILSTLERAGINVERAKIILVLESVLTDPIGVITCITLIRMIMFPTVSLLEGFKTMFLSFSNSIIIGSIVGMLWAAVLDKLRGKPLTYMITLAVVFLSYIVSEEIGGEGSGALAVLIFGLIITNFEYIAKILEFKRIFKIEKQLLREFHEEITFFMKSFFFVYIGLIISISQEQIIAGLLAVGIILAVRYIAASISSMVLKLNQLEKGILTVTVASGLPAMIMSQLPLIYDPNRQYFTSPEIYPNICFIVVIVTVLYGAFIAPYIAKRKAASLSKQDN